MNSKEHHYSERKAAIALGISRESLRKYRAMGLIKPLVIAHAVLYPQSTLNEWSARYIIRRGKPLAEKR